MAEALRRLRRFLVGEQLDPLNPETRRHIVLVAFLAWIGLGADGLSSSCYGPEEAFLALGAHPQLGLFLALATGATVFVIALAYNQVIELFPSGGGGYKAATRLIGPFAGLVSGSALIVDYVLTITISIAAGADALFSLLPAAQQDWKLVAEVMLTLLLIALNLRGMKESILVLLPIFLGFFLSHAALIVYGIGVHASALPQLWPQTLSDSRALAGQTSWMFVAALFLRAYSLGGGTYTGIEAVSNNINMLVEPRVRTGHWTMFYMATSLAFTAGGIILLYLLWQVAPVEGQTLNAVVFDAILQHAGLGNGDLNRAVLIAALALEAGLLFVAANTGFLGGPSVMANMAADRWVPRHFRQLSNRLVTQNGVLVMGIAALLSLLLTRGDVAVLVVLYSINVFLTFTLSLFGLCRHWWEQRHYQLVWRRRFFLSVVGFAVTAFILVVTVSEKFLQGAWATLLLTGAVIVGCLAIKRHYEGVRRQLARVDDLYSLRMTWDGDARSRPLDPRAPTAILLIGGNRGAGMYTLQWALKMFPGRFRNFIFVSVGEVDRQAFDGPGALKTLQARIDNSLNYFRSYCVSLGYAADTRQEYAADPLPALSEMTLEALNTFPDAVCFASKLVFDRESLLTRWLHNELPMTMQRRVQLANRELIIVPIQVPEEPAPKERVSHSR